MELILILLAVAGTGGGFLAGRRERASRRRALAEQARTASIAAAKHRGSDRAREMSTAATQVQPAIVQVRWSDMPPRVGIVPAADGAVYRETPTEVLEPVRTAEQILADFPPPPEIPSWRRSAAPVRAPELAEPAQAPSPLYAETLARIPVAQPEADVDELRWSDETPSAKTVEQLEEAAAKLAEPVPDDEDLPQDEARVTGLHRSDDDEEPPSGPPDDDTSDTPRLDQTEPLAAVAAYRHDWSASEPVAPLHGARPHSSLARDPRQWMAAQTRQVWARVWAVPQLQVQRPSWWRRMWRDLAAWWAENVAAEAESVAAETSQGWGPEDLGDGHLIVRHRRRRGTWAVA